MTETLLLVLSVIEKLLPKLPDYSQRKKESFYKLKEDYEKEISKDYPDRDDNLVSQYYDELRTFFQVFLEEISK